MDVSFAGFLVHAARFCWLAERYCWRLLWTRIRWMLFAYTAVSRFYKNKIVLYQRIVTELSPPRTTFLRSVLQKCIYFIVWVYYIWS